MHNTYCNIIYQENKHENTQAVINRLSREIGHLESVKRMVEDGRNCSKVLIQIAAVKSAVLYAISLPISKILLKEIPPTMMAAFLYLGAGVGMAIIDLFRYKIGKVKMKLRLTSKEIIDSK